MSAPADQRQRYRPGSLEILAVGLVLLIIGQRWLVGLFDDPALQTGATIFVSIVVQALPFLVLGVVLSGAIAAFVPASFWRKALPKNPALAVPVAVLAGAAVVWRGGLALPTAPPGWWGLALLTLLYGTGITILFTVLPRLGVVGNSAVMNVEPVFALVLAWLILDQHIAPVQVVGALVVVGAVIWLGTRRK